MVENRKNARELASQAVGRGAPLEWFEELYEQAKGDSSAIPWADMTINPNVAEWLEHHPRNESKKTALVIGCGLGDDAEALASLGYKVCAFDISTSCIQWCQQRFPESTVDYTVTDLFVPPATWLQAFDFVLETYTLQVLPPELRRAAMQHISNFVAPDGTLLVVARGRDEGDAPGKMPWPLLKEEFNELCDMGMKEIQFEDYVEAEDPPVRRFRAEYHRSAT